MLKLFKYQEEGIELICNKYKDVLLADHPGAGKTCQVIRAADKLATKKILVICPASLRENWKREFKKWSIRDLNIVVAFGIKELSQRADVYIISYDLATKGYFPNTDEVCLLVLDEAHYLKNSESLRTKNCLNIYWKRAKKRIAITGTPLPNGRAIEGFSLFSKLCPREFGKKREYLDTYCIKEQTPWGVNYNRSKNLEHLGKICRREFMIRRPRAETVGQLPDLIRMKVSLDGFSLDTYQENMSDNLLGKFDFTKELPPEIKSEWRMHGIQKVFASVEYIKHLLKEVKNCVVFAYHKDVVRELSERLTANTVTNCVVNGDTDVTDRQGLVDKFQNGDVKVFIASLKAASTGITLTAASDVVFVECDWVPSTNEQAEGRCYRVSQTQITRSHYLVIPDSLDDTITSAVIRKQKNITKVMSD